MTGYRHVPPPPAYEDRKPDPDLGPDESGVRFMEALILAMVLGLMGWALLLWVLWRSWGPIFAGLFWRALA
jgi:hypothetical protein